MLTQWSKLSAHVLWTHASHCRNVRGLGVYPSPDILQYKPPGEEKGSGALEERAVELQLSDASVGHTRTQSRCFWNWDGWNVWGFSGWDWRYKEAETSKSQGRTFWPLSGNCFSAVSSSFWRCLSRSGCTSVQQGFSVGSHITLFPVFLMTACK